MYNWRCLPTWRWRMTWIEYHTASERLAEQAQLAKAQGDTVGARSLYGEAARSESLALQQLERSKTRTLSVTAVSAASLYFKAADFAAAEALAHTWLTDPTLAPFAAYDLRELLQAIWSEQARQESGVRFAEGDILVSVSGGDVVRGGAPLDLIVERVQTIQSMFFRTAEWLMRVPHRTRGQASQEIQSAYAPWLFQAVPGSYQFAVALQEPPQLSLFGPNGPPAAEVASEFVRILEAIVEAPTDELPKVVDDQAYRSTMLKLTRSLAPTGKRFTRMDIQPVGGRRVILVPATRRSVSEAIRVTSPPKVEGHREIITGILRAVHLDKDWIEVMRSDRTTRITGVGEAVDDLIGPMVNHPVVVQVAVDAQLHHRFIDIERDE